MVKLIKAKRSTKSEPLPEPRTKELKKRVYLDASRAHRFKRKATEMNKLSAIVAEKFQSLNLLPYSYSEDNIGSYLLDEIQNLNTFEQTHDWYVLHKKLEQLTFNLSLIVLNKEKIVGVLLKDYAERPVNRIPVLRLLFQLVRDLKDDCYDVMVGRCIELVIDCANSEDLRLIEHSVALLAAFLKFSNRAIKTHYVDFVDRFVGPLFDRHINKKTMKAIAEALTYTYKKAASYEAKAAIIGAIVSKAADVLRVQDSLSTTHKVGYFLAGFVFEATKNFKNVLDYQARLTLDILMNFLKPKDGDVHFIPCANIALRMLVYRFAKMEYRYKRDQKTAEEVYLYDLLSHLMLKATEENEHMVDGLIDALCEFCLFQDGILLTDGLLTDIKHFIDINVLVNQSSKFVTLMAVLLLKKSFWCYAFIDGIAADSVKTRLFLNLLAEAYFQHGLQSLELSSVRGKGSPKVQKLGYEGVTSAVVHSFISTLLDVVAYNPNYSNTFELITALSIGDSYFNNVYLGKRIKPKNEGAIASLLGYLSRIYNQVVSDPKNEVAKLELYLLLKFLLILNIESCHKELKIEVEGMIETLYALRTAEDAGLHSKSLYTAEEKEVTLTELEVLGYRTRHMPNLLLDYNISTLTELYIGAVSTSQDDDKVYLTRLTPIFAANYNDYVMLRSLNSIISSLDAKSINTTPMLESLLPYFIFNLANQNTKIVKISLDFLSHFPVVAQIAPEAHFLKEETLTSYLENVN